MSRPTSSSTKPSSIIASLRKVSSNFALWLISLRSPAEATIAPRASADSITLMA
jgi:hypothetical protein